MLVVVLLRAPSTACPFEKRDSLPECPFGIPGMSTEKGRATPQTNLRAMVYGYGYRYTGTGSTRTMAAMHTCRDVPVNGATYSVAFAPSLRCSSLLAIGGETHISVKSVSLGVSEYIRLLTSAGRSLYARTYHGWHVCSLISTHIAHNSHTYTHIHTHTRTHARTHAHAHTGLDTPGGRELTRCSGRRGGLVPAHGPPH